MMSGLHTMNLCNVISLFCGSYYRQACVFWGFWANTISAAHIHTFLISVMKGFFQVSKSHCVYVNRKCITHLLCMHYLEKKIKTSWNKLIQLQIIKWLDSCPHTQRPAGFVGAGDPAKANRPSGISFYRQAATKCWCSATHTQHKLFIYIQTQIHLTVWVGYCALINLTMLELKYKYMWGHSCAYGQTADF